MYHSNTHHPNTRRYTLQDLIHDKKFQDLWNLERFVAVVTGIIRGMSFLHSKKVIHRDLKPENIMINIYPNKLIKVKEWFSQSGIMELYKSELGKILPDNFNKMENSKKKIARKRHVLRRFL